MAPRTRAAKAREAAAACLLLDLSHDEVSIVTHELCDPLQPLLAVHLSITAKGLREAMEVQLAELKQQWQQAKALALLSRSGQGATSCANLRDAKLLLLGARRCRPLALTHWRTLGTLARCRSLPALQQIEIIDDGSGDAGVELLAAGLRRGSLPSLWRLVLWRAQIGPQGASALATALTERAVPSLKELDLDDNHLGGAGLAALAPALRQLPALESLFLRFNQITDQGLASLLALATAGVLMSLQSLNLYDNQITDEGCAALASALGGGALPALEQLELEDNPASKQARRAACEVLDARQLLNDDEDEDEVW